MSASPMTDVDYDAVLADLRARREQIDRAIAAIEAMQLGAAPTRTSAVRGPGRESAAARVFREAGTLLTLAEVAQRGYGGDRNSARQQLWLMAKRGEVRRVARGTYEYVAEPLGEAPTEGAEPR